jgi:hypothetical protein
MPRARFEPAIPANKRPQNYALNLSATGIGEQNAYFFKIQHLIHFREQKFVEDGCVLGCCPV